jgi:predicted flap endonuclease-1-like 5' DNA nuclease
MLEIIIAFIVGVIVGLLVAWYPSRQQVHTCEAQVQGLRNSLSQNERVLQKQGADLDHMKEQLFERDRKIRELTAQLDWRKITIGQLTDVVSEREGQLQALQSRATPAIALETKPDNLKRIEGIGPKISQLLQDAGIMTFAQLAATDLSRLQQIIADAGLSALADPTTWSQQAQLAAESNWGALQTLQDELKGGRRV